VEKKMNDWKNYIDVNGNFELPNFLYKTINELMKQSLDMGTLLSDDQYKLRAYKEQIKKLFKNKWYSIAESLEFFNLIEECVCKNSQKENYCDVCKGARYVISSTLSPDEMREIGVFINARQDVEIMDKLQKSLMQALNDVQ
jgi:hypothetical protein